MSDADRFAAMDTQHDLCDEYPCWQCEAEHSRCDACGEPLEYTDECERCKQFFAMLDFKNLQGVENY